jgi:guanosine-3',5'-bis(diphosphate) 3'-pyrophosphohydrolase
MAGRYSSAWAVPRGAFLIFSERQWRYISGCNEMEPAYIPLVKQVADVAARAHGGQFRKDRQTPYIIHPARVAQYVTACGGTHIGVIAAWLHDAIEDAPDGYAQAHAAIQSLSLPDPEKERIWLVVLALTKDMTITPREARSAECIRRILQAPHEAVLVKLCDRLDNVMDLEGTDTGYRRWYGRETEALIERLSSSAEQHGYFQALSLLREQNQNAMR